ncbi:MAG: hypothetical protein JNK25_06595 [Phycisphaerae bacterium]|nr:hypothetical protein [Phycisphaerae bacterium]
MTIKRRVAALEKKARPAAAVCAGCGGKGWPAVVVVNDAGEVSARLLGCRACGRASDVKALGGGIEPGAVPAWVEAV